MGFWALSLLGKMQSIFYCLETELFEYYLDGSHWVAGYGA
jgi:hypothetical protein